MVSPLALILDDDRSARERACDALTRAGINSIAVATPREALDVLRNHPSAVIAIVDGGLAPPQLAQLQALFRLRSEDTRSSATRKIVGRSEASDTLRGTLQSLAATQGPVLFCGEPGSGREHAARCLHGLVAASEPFIALSEVGPSALAAASAQAEGIVFVPAIERLAWPAQEALAEASSVSRGARWTASTSLDPEVAVDEGRLSRRLVSAFAGAIVRVPPLREHASDIATLARSFVEELCRLNGLAPISLAPEAVVALESFAWPGNVRQLRSAIESSVIVAPDGVVRGRDLPEFLRAPAVPRESSARADRRFRDAKRSVVEAFERSYLEDLLRRHGGNVTGAAEQSGMLRSALQRLLRKHDLHSADFRGRGAPGLHGS